MSLFCKYLSTVSGHVVVLWQTGACWDRILPYDPEQEDMWAAGIMK